MPFLIFLDGLKMFKKTSKFLAIGLTYITSTHGQAKAKLFSERSTLL
jgi:hypothetical protein